MRIRRLMSQRFRAIEWLELRPGLCTVIIGPNNAGKSTVLEALDQLLDPGLGRRRPDPTDVDYFGRDLGAGFEIEAVVGDLDVAYQAEVLAHLEGWRDADSTVTPEPNGDGIEPVGSVCPTSPASSAGMDALSQTFRWSDPIYTRSQQQSWRRDVKGHRDLPAGAT